MDFLAEVVFKGINRLIRFALKDEDAFVNLVYQAEKRDSQWHQRIDIYYSCVGDLKAPEDKSVPAKTVTLQTRKGSNARKMCQ